MLPGEWNGMVGENAVSWGICYDPRGMTCARPGYRVAKISLLTAHPIPGPRLCSALQPNECEREARSWEPEKGVGWGGVVVGGE